LQSPVVLDTHIATLTGPAAASAVGNNNQFAAVMTAEDGIAIATYRITSAYTGYSLYLTVGRKMHTKLCLFTWVSGFPSNIWCLGPVRVHIPKGTAGSLPALGAQGYGQQT